MKATGHRPPGISKTDWERQAFLVHDYDSEVTPYLWRDATPPPGTADHPVVLVSAADAEEFCAWVGPGGRLPTEAEWEKAARGEDGRIFPWGDAWDSSRLSSAGPGPGSTTPVHRYSSGASPFGVLDAAATSSSGPRAHFPTGAGW